MSHNQPTEHPNDRGGHRTYLLPHRIHRVLDTTAQLADALRGIVRNQEPAAIRVHSVSAMVWLFRVTERLVSTGIRNSLGKVAGNCVITPTASINLLSAAMT